MRAPGYYERHFICRNLEGYYTNFNIISRYNHRLTPELLSNVLHSLIDKEPILALNFFRKDGSTRDDDHYANGHNFVVRPVAKIDFADVVSFETVDRFDESTFKYINPLTCPVNIELPLWRMIVFDSKEDGYQYVCIYFEHALFDGGSGAQFHQDIAATLDEIDSSNDAMVERLFTSRESISIPEACEYTTNLFEPSLLTKLSFLSEKYNILPNWTSYNYWTKSNSPQVFKTTVPTTKDLATDYLLFNLNPTDLETIRKFCQREKIAITSYLEILGTFVFTETFLQTMPNDEKGSNGVWSTSTLIAVSGRRHVPSERFQYGTLVTGDIYTLPPIALDSTPSQLISLMKGFHNKLHKSVQNKTCFEKIGLYDYMNLWDFYKNKLNKTERHTLSVSNLGLIKTFGKWQILDMWFGSNTGVAYNFIFNVTSTPCNGLNIVMSYRPEFGEVRDPATNELMIDVFKRKLDQQLVAFAKYKI
ncbi:hypothetical protein CAAN1_21S02102 [[Candida] anglica]|uniref:Alcohol acetyltransferase n=1 Tax=[Candida] anglica TaxID=148631 RepID=A0ABP0EE09_9ASCO